LARLHFELHRIFFEIPRAGKIATTAPIINKQDKRKSTIKNWLIYCI
jgi:hypothetical protein